MNIEKEIQSREKEMKKVRDKKIKHALKIHGEGRVFMESCLIKRGETQKLKTAENISRTPKTVSVTSNRDSHRMGEKQTSENSKAPTRSTATGNSKDTQAKVQNPEHDTSTHSNGKGGDRSQNGDEDRRVKGKWVPYGKYAANKWNHSGNKSGGWSSGYQGWQGPGWGPGWWWNPQPWWAGSQPVNPWQNRNGWVDGRNGSTASWSSRISGRSF